MGEKKKYTLLVVDDEPIISDGLKSLFEEEFPDIFQVYITVIIPKRRLSFLSSVCRMLW